MISVFLCEQRRYTLEQLIQLFYGSNTDVQEILKLLRYKGLVKTVNKSAEQAGLSDLTDDNVVTDDSPNSVFYVFSYVGVIAVKDVILKCYPKYIKKSQTPVKQLKQVLRVIEKYCSQSQEINLYEDSDGQTTVNKLAVMIFLLKDYFEYGLYSNIKDMVEENGRGEILWDKTINDTYALLNSDVPYYPLLYTRHHVTDEQDFFRRLHACVLYKISNEFELAGLIELFDVASVPQPDEELEELGDDDYLIYRLDRELDVEYNTRKQLLLKAMAAYIANQDITCCENDSVSLYGTTSFNLVWENVCNAVLGDQRSYPMGVLELPGKLSEKYDATEMLISVIEKPGWYGLNSDGTTFCKRAVNTLVPDFLSICKIGGKYCFIILDAKYYNLQLESSKLLSGQPGIESVTKQYLYELAYTDFIRSNHIEVVTNCFLFPSEEDTVQVKGYVELSFLHSLGLQNISIRLLPAAVIFEYYLSECKMPIEKLQLDLGAVDYGRIDQGTTA